MKQIVLFRFHRSADVCLNRIHLLNKYNPGIEIYGLYGGEKNASFYKNKLKDHLEHFYSVNKPEGWNWKNSDLAVRMWFKEYGKTVEFDTLHLIEWDMLLLDSLGSIYKQVPQGGIALTGLRPLREVDDKWDWLLEEPSKGEWKRLLELARSKFGYNDIPYASMGPGPSFPRSFLEKYSEIEVPELAHDELRLPLFAQILGFKMFDTGFYKKWFNNEEKKFFNCKGREIKPEIIREELKKPNGRRVFHPYRKVFLEETAKNQK